MSVLETGEVLDAIDAKRHEVVSIAADEIGDQVKGHPILLNYWRDVGCLDHAGRPCNDWQLRQQAGCIPGTRGLEWCQQFALWVYHKAKLTDMPATLGTTFARMLPTTTSPEPGDLFIAPGVLGHHGIVVSLKDGVLESIEGNTPDVRRRKRKPPHGIKYYSIMPWIRKALDV